MKGISLPSFLQVVELERQTCSVEVKSQGKRGYLQFQGGVLVHARSGSTQGEDAAYDILAWDDPEVDVDTQPNAVEPSIDASVTALLLESTRRKDESDRGAGAAAGSSAAPQAAPAGEEAGGQPAQALAEPPPAATLPDIALFAGTVQRAREHLGDALLAIDVYALADGQPIAGFNSQPRWAAYLAQMTGRVAETLVNCGMPSPGSHYLFDLDGSRTVLVVPGRRLQWSLLFDGSRAPLGLLLNVVLPELRAGLGEF